VADANTNPENWVRIGGGRYRNKITEETLTGQAGNPAVRGKYASGASAAGQPGTPPPAAGPQTPAQMSTAAAGTFFGDSAPGALAGSEIFRNFFPTPTAYQDPYKPWMDILGGQKWQEYEGAGQTTPELRAAFNSLLGLQGQAGAVDPTQSQILERLLRESEVGYTPDEMTRLREGESASLNRNIQGALRGAGATASTSGLRGGSAGALQALAMRGYTQDLSDMEKRLFEGLVRRKDEKLGEAAGLAKNLDDTRFSRMQNTGRDVMDAGFNIQEANRQDRANKFQQLYQVTTGAADSNFNVFKYNTDSMNAWRAADLGGFMSGGQYRDTRKDIDKGLALQEKAIESMGNLSMPGFGGFEGGDDLSDLNGSDLKLAGPTGGSLPASQTPTGPTGRGSMFAR
jgi:hypothetical protein